MSMTHPIQIVIGGLYGSEAKGAIAAYLAVRDKMDVCCRTGATNAGHSAFYGDKLVVLQQLPIGFVRAEAQLVLGAGALIDVDILNREVAMLNALTGTDVRQRLTIDYRAYVHRSVHHDRAVSANRHHLVGSTSKGCSEALVDRVRLRGLENWTVGHNEKLFDGFTIGDTEQTLNDAWDEGAKIQLEGTQGQLLDLYLGPYPYTTHKQTGPAQWMLEAGLSPALPTDIVMVIRTYPIRVAGNSGPMPQEISWPILAREINQKRRNAGLTDIVSESAICAFEEAVMRATAAFGPIGVPAGSNGLDQHEWADRMNYRTALSELNKVALSHLSDTERAQLSALFEMTTVTKKLRRVARLDLDELARSARQIRPHQIAVTFMNYEFPVEWFNSTPISDRERAYLTRIEMATDSRVTLVNRGPAPEHIIATAEV